MIQTITFTSVPSEPFSSRLSSRFVFGVVFLFPALYFSLSYYYIHFGSFRVSLFSYQGLCFISFSFYLSLALFFSFYLSLCLSFSMSVFQSVYIYFSLLKNIYLPQHLYISPYLLYFFLLPFFKIVTYLISI